MSVWACESVFGGGGQQGVQQQQTVNVCMLYVLKASSRGQKTQGYSLRCCMFYLSVLWKHTGSHFSLKMMLILFSLTLMKSECIVVWCSNVIRLVVQSQKCAKKPNLCQNQILQLVFYVFIVYSLLPYCSQLKSMLAFTV